MKPAVSREESHFLGLFKGIPVLFEVELLDGLIRYGELFNFPETLHRSTSELRFLGLSQ